MRAAVESYFPTFTEGFEGHVRKFYRDVEDLVSIGDGLLAEPIGLIAGLDFVNDADGSIAAWSDVTAAWMAVKTAKIDASKGGKYREFAALTRVSATDEALAHLESVKLASIEAAMRRVFPAWDTWPADAQLATLSMCWAMGAGRIPASYPHFISACRARDWNTAAVQCHMSEVDQTDSFKRRNVANAMMFRNAARSTDPDVLSYPAELAQ